MKRLSLTPDTISPNELYELVSKGKCVVAHVYTTHMSFLVSAGRYTSSPRQDDEYWFQALRGGSNTIHSRTVGWDAFMAKVKGSTILVFETSREAIQYALDNVLDF